jgi:hypothetical protein
MPPRAQASQDLASGRRRDHPPPAASERKSAARAAILMTVKRLCTVVASATPRTLIAVSTTMMATAIPSREKETSGRLRRELDELLREHHRDRRATRDGAHEIHPAESERRGVP